MLDYESSSTYYDKIMQSPRSTKNGAQISAPQRSGREDSKLSAVQQDVGFGGIRVQSNNRVIQTTAYNYSGANG